MSEKIFTSEQKLSRAEISEHLRKIAQGLDSGQVTLNSGNDSVNLEIPENSELEIKVEQEADGEKSLEIEIEWKQGQEENSLEIS